MNSQVCVIDACSLINIIHINDEKLIRRLEFLTIHLSEKVFEEFNKNFRRRLDFLKALKIINENDYDARVKSIDLFANKLRTKVIWDSEIQYEWGDNLFKSLQKYLKTKKINGEFCSSVLSLFLSRFQQNSEHSKNKWSISQNKVLFHTDDIPAYEDYREFFSENQIGFIEDSVDLIIFLYTIDENFTKKDLRNNLSELYSQYVIGVTELEKKLKDFRRDNQFKFRKDRKYVNELNTLIDKLNKLDFKGLSATISFFESSTKYSKLNKIIKEYSFIKELENSPTNLLKKIKSRLDRLDVIVDLSF